MTTRQERRQIVLELVNRNQITSQEQLQELLIVEGVQATQATISRDMRDLGIIKTGAGYKVLDLDAVSRTDVKDLKQRWRSEVRSIDRAASVLVVRTAFGTARALAARLDQANLPQIVGTIASDDTIFLATRSSGQAGELKRILERLGK